jgi:hypothetical protein
MAPRGGRFATSPRWLLPAERHEPRQLRVDVVQARGGVGDGGETDAPAIGPAERRPQTAESWWRA